MRRNGTWLVIIRRLVADDHMSDSAPKRKDARLQVVRFEGELRGRNVVVKWARTDLPDLDLDRIFEGDQQVFRSRIAVLMDINLPPGITGPVKSAKMALRALVSPLAKLVRIARAEMA